MFPAFAFMAFSAAVMRFPRLLTVPVKVVTAEEAAFAVFNAVAALLFAVVASEEAAFAVLWAL